MTENERELLFKTIGEVGLLKIEVAALQELVITLAIALTEKPNASLSDTVTTMDAIRLLTRWTKGEDTAAGMAYVINSLRALSQVPPLQTLTAAALLHRQAGDSMRQPLQSWLSQATPDEIGQDVRQALQRLIVETKHQSGGDGSQGD